MSKSYPNTPPTEAVEIRRVEPREPASSWPTYLGLAALVFGFGGVLTGALGILSPWITEWAGSRVGNDPAVQQQLELSRKLMWWILTSSSLFTVLALMLVIAGAGICARRQWGVRLMKAWAAGKIGWVVIATTIGFLILDQAGVSASMPGMSPLFKIIANVASIGWQLALPVFSLVWLRTAAAKQDISMRPRSRA